MVSRSRLEETFEKWLEKDVEYKEGLKNAINQVSSGIESHDVKVSSFHTTWIKIMDKYFYLIMLLVGGLLAFVGIKVKDIV